VGQNEIFPFIRRIIVKIIQLNQVLKFLLQSIVAGLAIAFLLLFYFPEFLSGTSRPDSEADKSSGPARRTVQTVSYSQAVTLSAPAVVNVYATRISERRSHPLFQDPLFRRFFGGQGPNRQRNTSLGSGVIMSSDGMLITNAHNIKAAHEIHITLADGRQTLAEVVGIDEATDLAVLKIQLEDLPVITIGDSDDLNVGDVVLAIGNPYDFGQTVTQGIVGAIGRKRLGITTYENFIQTDADINPGNSGGALITATGQLAGINTALFSPGGGGSQGIGFAIPVNIAVDVMHALIEHGHVVRGYLGIGAQEVPSGITDDEGNKQIGVLVRMVMKNGPADQAGIIPGDIITELQGKSLHNPSQTNQLIANIQPGTLIELRILRGWEEKLLKAVLIQQPNPQ